jgi:hypothetical protein
VKIRKELRKLKARLRGRSLRAADHFDTEYVSESSPIVIGGVARSGTTLLRVMLDSHRNICCGPESWLFTERRIERDKLAYRFDIPEARLEDFYGRARSRAEFIDLFFAEYCRKMGKPRWAEKTPQNITRLDTIFRAFPRARFIHLIRDGRDVACSLRAFPRHEVVNGQLVPLNTWKPIGPCVERWVAEIEMARPYRADPRYLEVRYEDLVRQPRSTLETVIAFGGEPWDENMLRHHEIDTPSRDVSKFPQNPEATEAVNTEALGRWKTDLSDEDKAIVKQIAGGLLRELGYADTDDW